MQALAARRELTHLQLTSCGISCPPHLLAGGFPKRQSLVLVVAPAHNQEHEFLAAMRHVTVLIAMERHLDSHRAHITLLQPWGICRDSALLTAVKPLDPTCQPAVAQTLIESVAAVHHCLNMPALDSLKVVARGKKACPCAQIDWAACCSSLTSIHVTFSNSNLAKGSVAEKVLQGVPCMRNLRSLGVHCWSSHTGQMSVGVPLPPHLTNLELEREECDSLVRIDCNTTASSHSLRNLHSLQLSGFKFVIFAALTGAVSSLTTVTCLVLQQPMSDAMPPLSDESVQSLCSALSRFEGLAKCHLNLEFSAAQLLTICKTLEGNLKISSVSLLVHSEVSQTYSCS